MGEVYEEYGVGVENLTSCFEEIRTGGRRGRAIYLYLHLLTHEQHLPDLEADLRAIFPQLPTDDQAILEFVINELEYNLILCFTGSRESQPIIDSQMESAKKKEAAPLAAMDQVKAIAYEMKKALLASDLDRFGEMLHEGWLQKKQMAKGITTPRIDELYDEARKAGAIGGKITGAGGGGHLLLYCPFNKRHIVRERLSALGTSVTDFRFDPVGMQTWRVYK
jgi:galactokinase/mevalonate kinase-like predicted kinase